MRVRAIPFLAALILSAPALAGVAVIGVAEDLGGVWEYTYSISTNNGFSIRKALFRGEFTSVRPEVVAVPEGWTWRAMEIPQRSILFEGIVPLSSTVEGFVIRSPDAPGWIQVDLAGIQHWRWETASMAPVGPMRQLPEAPSMLFLALGLAALARRKTHRKEECLS